ncbi:hypothetical protein Patl1_20352 [Pistacia atlantica]|uniref:Uncharacterized protein n=1 Tax=Pistacia atlantica TaxID=434234 RepID=A0ACC1BKG3_9ROSI|nr:hypothetical protein Patl1_20352 [Pistacia atlantica]
MCIGLMDSGHSSATLEELAYRNSLSLIECVGFKIEDYPGYNNKRGDGWRCDESFPLGECSTFKFRFSQPSKKKSRKKRNTRNANRRPQQLQELPIQTQKQGSSIGLRHYHTNLTIDMNRFPGYVGEPHRFDSFRHPPTNFNRNMNDQQESARISSSCFSFNNVRETLGRAGHRVDYTVHGSVILGLERYMEEAPERTLNGYAYMDELRRSNSVRSARLRSMVLDYGDRGYGLGI